jgi:hypothetical protein
LGLITAKLCCMLVVGLHRIRIRICRSSPNHRSTQPLYTQLPLYLTAMARRNLMLVTLCLLLAGATAQWGHPDNPDTETGREVSIVTLFPIGA